MDSDIFAAASIKRALPAIGLMELSGRGSYLFPAAKKQFRGTGRLFPIAAPPTEIANQKPFKLNLLAR